MNEVERAEILLDTYHQMASPVTEIAKMFKEHEVEARYDQRKMSSKKISESAYVHNIPNFGRIIAMYDAMNECLNATRESDD